MKLIMRTLLRSPSSIKTRFTVQFLRSIKNLNNKSRSNYNTKYMRYSTIRDAAYASMASAVGQRRAWSRALLKKIRNRTLHQFLTNRNRSNYRRRRAIMIGRSNPREAELRWLIPGGKAMSSCQLLKETAHYMKCLRAQVQVMTDILDKRSTFDQ